MLVLWMLLSSFVFVLILALPVLLVIRIIRYAMSTQSSSGLQRNAKWYSFFAESREDAVSQLFFTLSVGFFGSTLLTLVDKENSFAAQTVLLVTSLVALAIAYYFRALLSFLAGFFGLAVWWFLRLMEWADHAQAPSATLVGLALFALVSYVVGRAHEGRKEYTHFGLVYAGTGMVFVTGLLFFLSTHAGIKMLEEMMRGASFLASPQFAISFVILLAALVGTSLYCIKAQRLHPLEAGMVWLLTTIFVVLGLLPPQDVAYFQRGHSIFGPSILSDSGIFLAFIFNILLLFELIALLIGGYVLRKEWLINMGAVFFFLFIIIKYFDWFYSFSEKSLFFIGAGVLLIVIGWLMERGRRYIISQIREDTP